jgi:hypothetical protein
VAGHAHRLAQERRQVLRRGAVEAPRLRVDQPDPSGAQAEQIDDPRERGVQGALDVRRAVQRLGDVLEDAQVAGPRPLIS